MTDEDTSQVPLLESVGRATSLLLPVVERFEIYTWEGKTDQQYWEFFKRGIIKRQFEALTTIVFLAENKRGHFGVTLLRPAYEEMLWAAYLEKHKALAPRIALLLSRREVSATIDAQNQYLGAKAMQFHGFSQKRVKEMQTAFRPSLIELKEIGRALNWRNNEPPGAAALARATGYEKEYNFIYHATSKYVHFSAHELGRRVWGSQGAVKIGSDHFSAYWSDFALYWGFRIFMLVWRALSDLLPDEEVPGLEGLLDEVKTMYPVPIITARELEGW